MQAWGFMQAVSASSVLLKDLQTGSGFAVEGTIRPDPITSTLIAFEECYRLVLALGMQLLLPRALARMIYQSSQTVRSRYFIYVR